MQYTLMRIYTFTPPLRKHLWSIRNFIPYELLSWGLWFATTTLKG